MGPVVLPPIRDEVEIGPSALLAFGLPQALCSTDVIHVPSKNFEIREFLRAWRGRMKYASRMRSRLYHILLHKHETADITS